MTDDPRPQPRKILTLHLPLPVRELGQLGRAIERIWPGATMGDSVVGPDGTNDTPVYAGEDPR